MDADPTNYLASCDVVDHEHASIQSLAAELRGRETDEKVIANASFVWVRDQIQHSSDFQRGPVTCAASEVLRHGTGYCYAKSHLLAALLRANKIPAGLCYQRLSISGNGAPYSLHGLNAIYLTDFGWYRLDPRGNKPGVDAQFVPPIERLAFSTDAAGEYDLPEIHQMPLPAVKRALRSYSDWQDLANHLPDIA